MKQGSAASSDLGNSDIYPDTPCMPYMPTLTPQTTPMYAYMAYMECLGYVFRQNQGR